ncbi:hypothetical protein HK099_002435 [Clydaea vesicula]|uniref:Small ribosomal subunit protein mS29 n=1 Tax=Clydaea vesicula TaxID=447962 RepID=A0AAD5U481_9FUNG|nr:hypothetical protein HK099_002435 [Clydaea vesicula]KAJ3389104.1 hypothetical protein HDU92_001164 [Lobulomyces angularis]
MSVPSFKLSVNHFFPQQKLITKNLLKLVSKTNSILNNENFKSKALVLTGKAGIGKSTLLFQQEAFFKKNGWTTFNLSNLNSWVNGTQPYENKKPLVRQAELELNVLQNNFLQKEKPEEHDGIVGLRKFFDKLKESPSDRSPVLLSIDDFNAFFCSTEYYEDGKAMKSSRLALIKFFEDIINEGIPNGVIVASLTSSPNFKNSQLPNNLKKPLWTFQALSEAEKKPNSTFDILNKANHNSTVKFENFFVEECLDERQVQLLLNETNFLTEKENYTRIWTLSGGNPRKVLSLI